jgi:hypothetical protein
MSLTGATIMGVHPHKSSAEAACFGLAVAVVLSRRHPLHTAKMIARDLSADGRECTIRTAENLLQGHLSARSMTRLTKAYGTEFILEVWGVLSGGWTADEIIERYIDERADKARKEHEAWRGRVGRYKQMLGASIENTSGYSTTDRTNS